MDSTSARPLPSSFQQSKWIVSLAIGAAASLALTSAYAFALSSTSTKLGSFIMSITNPSVALIILRILSETTSLLLHGLTSFTFDIVLWSAASTLQGIAVPTLLSLSSGTGIAGLFELLFWRRSRHHISVLVRLLFLALIPTMAIVIFSEVEFVTIPVVTDSIFVSAGLGEFNATQAFDYSSRTLATYYVSQFDYVLTDPLQSFQVLTPDCPGSDCASFYFPGQAGYINPAIAEFNYTMTDVLILDSVQGWQVDFWALNQDVIPANSSAVCPTYGHSDYAFTLCLDQSPDNTYLIANWWVCPYNVSTTKGCLLPNSTWYTGNPLGSTALRFTRHTFDATYDPINGSIVSVDNVRPPVTEQTVLPTDLYAALGQTFGVIDPYDVHSPSNIQPNTSTSAFLNMFVEQFQTSQYNDGVANSQLSAMVSLITLTVLFFNPFGLNWYLVSNPTGPAPNLPNELYTTANIANLVPRVVVAGWTAVIYLLLGLMILLSCFVSLGWSMTIQRPPITRFPLIDFAARILSKGYDEGSLANILIELTGGDSKLLRKRLVKTKVYLGDVTPVRDEIDKVGKIGFSTMTDLQPLKRGELYE